MPASRPMPATPLSRKPFVLVLVITLMIAALLPALAPARAQAASGETGTGTDEDAIPVYLDGLTLSFDVPPVLIDGRALVPFRLLAEALGCQVDWDQENQRVHAVREATGSPSSGAYQPARVIDLFVNRTDGMINGQVRSMDVAPRIIDGRTLIPLRFFGEALSAEVSWDGAARTISVTSPKRPMTVLGFYALGDSQTSSWTELFGTPYPNTAVGAANVVSQVVCSWFVLDPATGRLDTNDSYSGQKRPDNWQDVVVACRSKGIQPEMMVHWSHPVNGVCDPAIYAFLSDTALMQTAVAGITDAAADFGGVNLDIELLGQRQEGDELAATKEKFTAFVKLLADALHARGKTLSLSLHPINSWYPGYDWQALGELADSVVIMAYGYVSSGPQPIDKVTEAVEKAIEVVPKAKLLLGLLAGKDGTYETAQSTYEKVGLAKREGIAGVALWRLGVWGDRLDSIRELVSPRPVS